MSDIQTFQGTAIRLCDIPERKDLTGLYVVCADKVNNSKAIVNMDFVQEAIDLKMRALQAVIDNCQMPYVPHVCVDNKNMLHKAYPRLLFQRNNVQDEGGIYYDVDLLAGHNYTLSVQGCVSAKGISKNRRLRVRIEDYQLTDDDELKVCEDIVLPAPNIILVGHTFVCPKDSHYRISIDYVNNDGTIVDVTTCDRDEYAYLEFIKLEEGAYVTLYADAEDEVTNQENLLPSALQDFSHKKGTVYQREYDGVFTTFLASTATKANDQFLSWVGSCPEIKRERTYTLSFKARGIGAVRCGLYLTEGSNQMNNFGVVDKVGNVTLPAENGSYASIVDTLTDTYKTYYYTFSLSHQPLQSSQIAVLFELLAKDQSIEIRCVKLECGGRPTAYIEDVSRSEIVKPANTPDE